MSQIPTGKKLILNILLYAAVFSCAAQVNENIRPVSFSTPASLLSPLQQTRLEPLNMDMVKKLDDADAKNGDLPKFSRSISTTLNLDNSGSWSKLGDGGRVWRLQVSSAGALALIPFFNKLYIPDGGALHVYMPGREELLGAFTSANNPADGYYCTGLVHGESFIIEYYEPAGAAGKGIINMNEIGYAYRWVPPLTRSADDFGEAGGCEVNVNCSEGADYQKQKRSVTRILVQGSFGQGWCTGTLVNNVRSDCTPYLISAQHCSEGVASHQFSQWVFYFNYESPNCPNLSQEGSLGNKVMIGCAKKADSNDNGGDKGSDFLLVQLTLPPLPTYQAYYAGWDIGGAPSASGRCIHHANGDVKKISTYNTPITSSTWNNVPNTHWRVFWTATPNGHGVTEEGSSGAPLFNAQGLLIGTLTGGSSSCQNPGLRDLFGKISYDWTSNGNTAAVQLKPWLDPGNTGTMALTGTHFPCGILDVTESDEAMLQVTPNPSNGVFMLGFNNGNEKLIKVYDAIGHIVAVKKTSEGQPAIDISNQPAGFYILRVEIGSHSVIKKIVLQ